MFHPLQKVLYSWDADANGHLVLLSALQRGNELQSPGDRSPQ